jgi:peptide/nickel transport system permease protein
MGEVGNMDTKVSVPDVQSTTTAPAPKKSVNKSPTRQALDRLRADKVAMISFWTVITFVLIAIFAPLLAKLEGQSPTERHFDLIDRSGFPTIPYFTAEHWFGVEPRVGRDLFARWVYGARPSLIVASIATGVTTIVGVCVGLVAGYVGGWVDRIITWITDLVLSLPALLFAIGGLAVLTNILGGAENIPLEKLATIRLFSLITVLSVFGWGGLARLIRGQVLSLREREFIAAAKVLGVPTRQILFRQLLPNLIAPIVVSVSLSLPAFIVTEAGLTFLGVGLTEPTPSWGITISAAQTWYRADWPYLWLPVLGIMILVLALSLLGDAIRDAFDPKTRR